LKNTPALGLSALFALAITCGAAQAQTLNATLTSSGTQSLSAGSDFSNGGEITVTASGVASGATVTINSVTLSVGNSAVFDTLTISILPADNPTRVTGGKLNLNGLTDLMTYFEYTFDYR